MKRGDLFTTVTFTVLALLCFAANSILCRLALSSKSIDPASFTAIRLFSGAVVLTLIVLASGKKPSKAGNWISAIMLFAYAIAFSLAYVGLKAGMGALLLFGSVQATMIIASMVAKKHPKPGQWIGLILAIAGLIWLTLPGLDKPPPPERALLMIVAGMAWGIYSVRGSGGADAVAATAGNFLRAAPFALLPLAFVLGHEKVSSEGALLAVVSGGATSGVGYVFWYTALPGLGAIRAAIVQLTVPVLAAIAGILLLHETLTPRLEVSTVIILSGVAIAVLSRKGAK